MPKLKTQALNSIYFPPGMKDLTTTTTSDAIIIINTSPELVNKLPSGTPDALSSSPAVCAVGTSSAYSLNNTTSRTIPRIAVLSIPEFNFPALLVFSFMFITSHVFYFNYFPPGMNALTTTTTNEAIIMMNTSPELENNPDNGIS